MSNSSQINKTNKTGTGVKKTMPKERNKKNIDQKIYQVLVAMQNELPVRERRSLDFNELRDKILLIKHNINASKRPTLLIPNEQIR